MWRSIAALQDGAGLVFVGSRKTKTDPFSA
jgi:hypothetical protein